MKWEVDSNEEDGCYLIECVLAMAVTERALGTSLACTRGTYKPKPEGQSLLPITFQVKD